MGDAREGKLPRVHENRAESAPTVVGGGGDETFTGGVGEAGQHPAVAEAGKPREEIAIDPGQTLNEIAALLSRESAWLNGPESGRVSTAISDLMNHESLSENALRDAIARVLDAGADMLNANDDAEGAELALAAREALVQDQLQDAAEIVRDVLGWYPVDRREPGA